MVDPKASCFSDTHNAYQSPARQLWEAVSSSGHPISQGPLWPPRVLRLLQSKLSAQLTLKTRSQEGRDKNPER